MKKRTRISFVLHLCCLMAALSLLAALACRAQEPDRFPVIPASAIDPKLGGQVLADLVKDREEAGDLLRKAVTAMGGKRWHVEGGVQEQSAPADAGGKPGDWKPVGTLTGVYSMPDFDFTTKGFPLGTTRRIATKGSEWTSTDGGGSWTVKQVRPGDLAMENWGIGLPFPIRTARLVFEPAGMEKHDDGMWAHIRSTDAAKALDYWILLDGNGEPLGVRRIISRWESGMTVAMQVDAYLYTVDLTPAKETERIVAPEGK